MRFEKVQVIKQPCIMKKHVFALLLLSIIASSLYAQKMAVGIKGGLNIADVSNMNGDNRLSGHIGLFLHSSLNRNWSVQPEILYSGQGQQFKVGNEELTLALSYIQIPVMFQYYPTSQLYLEFGPQLGFLLAANIKNDDNKAEVDDAYNKVDAGLGLGIGIKATRMLGFYARYNIGLADISDENTQDHYNRVGQIGMSIRFK
jgi:hypothetical protein